MNGTQTDGFSIDIYNEGLGVYLYDASVEESLRESGALITQYFGDDSFHDSVSKEFLSTGRLLVYGLVGDGSVKATVTIGAPLGKKQLSGGEWLTESGFLSLPSGRLCIHSANTLPMGDNGPRPDEAGACLEVPPGEYQVNVYRRADDEGGGPDRIVLTPWAKKPKIEHNILFGECIGFHPGQSARVVDGRIEARVIHAVQSKKEQSLAVNVDHKAADELRLRWGSRLRLSDGKDSVDAFFLGDQLAMAKYQNILGTDALQNLAPRGLIAFLATPGYRYDKPIKGYQAWLRIRAMDGAPKSALFSGGEGRKLSLVAVNEEPFEALPQSLAEPVVEGGAVRATVHASTPGVLVLEWGTAFAEPFQAIGHDGSTLLEVSAAGKPVLAAIEGPSLKDEMKACGLPLATFLTPTYHWGLEKQSVLALDSLDGTNLPILPAGAQVLIRKGT